MDDNDNDNPYSINFGKINNYVISTDGKRSNPPNYLNKNIDELKEMIKQGNTRIEESEKGFNQALADGDVDKMRLFQKYASEYRTGVNLLERKLNEKLSSSNGGKRSRKYKPYKRSRKSKKSKRSRKSKKSKRSRRI